MNHNFSYLYADDPQLDERPIDRTKICNYDTSLAQHNGIYTCTIRKEEGRRRAASR